MVHTWCPRRLKALIQRLHEPCLRDGSFPRWRLGRDNVLLVPYSGVQQGYQTVLVSDVLKLEGVFGMAVR